MQVRTQTIERVRNNPTIILDIDGNEIIPLNKWGEISGGWWISRYSFGEVEVTYGNIHCEHYDDAYYYLDDDEDMGVFLKTIEEYL